MLLNLTTIKPLSEGKTPLMISVKVDRRTAPYLVTSTDGLIWLGEDALDGDSQIRSAIRRDPMDDTTLYLDVIKAIAEVSMEAEWGNFQPYSKDGLVKAVGHVRDYVDSVEILAHSNRPEYVDMLPFEVVDADWLPEDILCVVAQDRSLLGELPLIGKRSWTMVVHNPARGIAICQKEDEDGEHDVD